MIWIEFFQMWSAQNTQSVKFCSNFAPESVVELDFWIWNACKTWEAVRVSVLFFRCVRKISGLMEIDIITRGAEMLVLAAESSGMRPLVLHLVCDFWYVLYLIICFCIYLEYNICCFRFAIDLSIVTDEVIICHLNYLWWGILTKGKQPDRWAQWSQWFLLALPPTEVLETNYNFLWGKVLSVLSQPSGVFSSNARVTMFMQGWL